MFEIGVTDPDILLAEKLLNWIHDKWIKEGKGEYISLPDIYQFSPIRDQKTAKRVVTLLQEHHYVKKHTGSMIINGHKRNDVWQIISLP